MATPLEQLRIEQLRMTWNSDSQADWPVAEILASLRLWCRCYVTDNGANMTFGDWPAVGFLHTRWRKI